MPRIQWTFVRLKPFEIAVETTSIPLPTIMFAKSLSFCPKSSPPHARWPGWSGSKFGWCYHVIKWPLRAEFVPQAKIV